MDIYVFFLIITIHYLADFIAQDGKWAEGKSSSMRMLLSHTLTYSTIWFIAILAYSQSWMGAIWFFLITFVTHTLVDYITSRVVKRKFKSGDISGSIPNTGAFSIIGLDQWIHYAQLALTYVLLFG